MATTQQAKNINFLRDLRKKVDEQQVRDRIMAKYAAILLGAFSFVVLLVFGIRLWIINSVKDVQTSITTVEGQLQTLIPIEKEYVVYAKKIKLLFIFDENRQLKRKAVTYFYNLVPKEYVLTEVVIDEESEQIEFQIGAADVFLATSLLDILRSNAVKAEGYTVSINNVSRVSDGKYVVAGTLGYKGVTK